MLPERHVEVAGNAVRCIDAGSGPPLLFLHGNPDSAVMWSAAIERLARRHRCVAPDLPGFGASAPAGAGFTPEDHVAFLDALLAACGVDGPVGIVVHDIGGFYGLPWVARDPRRARALVVCNSMLFPDYRWHFWARVWRTPLIGELAMGALFRTGFAWEMRRGSPHLARRDIDAAWRLYTPAVRRAVLRFYRGTKLDAFARWEPRLLDAIGQVPTLVLWGDRDPYFPPAFAERFGAARLRRFPDRGHWVVTEARREVCDLLAEFLDPPAAQSV